MNLWDLHLPAPGIYPLSLPIADLRGPFTGIEFSNNCRWLLVCHGHTAITVWDLDLDSIRATSSERVGRNLSEAEWKTIFPTEEYRKTFRILPCDSKAYNKARQLARDGKIEEAVTTFREIIRNDPGVRLDPVAEARALAAPRHVEQAEETILKLAHDASEPFSVAQQAVEARYLAGLEEFKRAKELNLDLPWDPQRRAAQLASKQWLVDADGYAENGDLDSAVATYDMIRKRYPNAHLDYDGLRSKAKYAWEKLANAEAINGRLDAAREWVRRIQDLDSEAAGQTDELVRAVVARHRLSQLAKGAVGEPEAPEPRAVTEALSLVAGLDVSTSTEVQLTVAEVLLLAGKNAIAVGEIELAVERYRKADQSYRRANAVGSGISAEDWHLLCLRGCLAGHAQLVAFAGENAVSANEYDSVYHDTLGLAHALNGNLEEAEREFQSYIEHESRDQEAKAQRAVWIKGIKKGNIDWAWREMAERQARGGNAEGAEQWIQRIGQRDSKAGEETRELVQALVAEYIASTALKNYNGGSTQIRDEELSETIQTLRDLAESDSPEVREKTADAFVIAGRLAVQRREIAEGVELYRRADDLYSALGKDDAKVSADDWNQLCWHGCLERQAELVEFAGERAIAADVTDDDSGYHDTLGLARALVGKFDEAIEEFEEYLVSTSSPESRRAKRRTWIAALKDGRDPFTEEVLKDLRSE